jgi:predicted dehydrogenase
VPDIAVTVLVDRVRVRAEALARRFGVPRVCDRFEQVGSKADAVLIALPNHLHAPVAISFLRGGIPVLVEKPMATSAVEARAMVEAAAAGGVPLQVGLMMRFAPAARAICRALDSEVLGAVTSFEVEWGERFRWPLVTGSGMVPQEAGGGVLLDFGSHLLDLLCWWLGHPELIAYHDDSQGGLEADCELEVRLSGPFGRVTGIARFSRLRDLGNCVRLVGDRAVIEWEHTTGAGVRLSVPTPRERATSFFWEPTDLGVEGDVFAAQLRAFARAVRSGVTPVPGESALPAIELIDQCYRQRQRLVQPWEHPILAPSGAS